MMAALSTLLLSFYLVMSPIRTGGAREYWRIVCGIDRDSNDICRPRAGVYPPRDGCWIYFYQQGHRQIIHRAPEVSVTGCFSIILHKLNAADPNLLQPGVRLGLQRWKNARLDASDPWLFTSMIVQADMELLKQSNPREYEYRSAQAAQFNQHWREIRLYPIDLVLEAAYFTGIVLFAVWPWLKRKSPLNWAVHLGLMPLALLLPCYLGYGYLVQTSPGPSGGAFYPVVISVFRVGGWAFNPADDFICRRLPQILAPMRQSLSPLVDIGSGPLMGPLEAIVLSVLVGLVTYFLRKRRPKRLAATGRA